MDLSGLSGSGLDEGIQKERRLIRKPEVAEAISESLDLTQGRGQELLSQILEEITLALSRKEEVTLPGFGTFVPRLRKERQGNNPRDGSAITIAAHHTVIFRPHKKLKEML